MAFRTQKKCNGNLTGSSGDRGRPECLLPYQTDATSLGLGKSWIGKALKWGSLEMGKPWIGEALDWGSLGLGKPWNWEALDWWKSWAGEALDWGSLGTLSSSARQPGARLTCY